MTDANHRDRPGKLLERLESFEQLHLLILVAADPARRWTVDELSDGQDPNEVPVIAQELVDAGVLVRGPGETVSLSTDPAVSDGAASLLRSYEENPLPVIQALTKRSMDRLRSAAARTFSEAFVVRRKDS